MNLNLIWPQDDRQPAIDYYRAVSTGPVTPLVISLTTVRDVAHVFLSYRTTVFPAPAIAHIKDYLLNTLTNLHPQS